MGSNPGPSERASTAHTTNAAGREAPAEKKTTTTKPRVAPSATLNDRAARKNKELRKLNAHGAPSTVPVPEGRGGGGLIFPDGPAQCPFAEGAVVYRLATLLSSPATFAHSSRTTEGQNRWYVQPSIFCFNWPVHRWTKAQGRGMERVCEGVSTGAQTNPVPRTSMDSMIPHRGGGGGGRG